VGQKIKWSACQDIIYELDGGGIGVKTAGHCCNHATDLVHLKIILLHRVWQGITKSLCQFGQVTIAKGISDHVVVSSLVQICSELPVCGGGKKGREAESDLCENIQYGDYST
jgi:hypothetical protein